MKKLGLVKLLDDDPTFRYYIHEVLAMAYLPPEYIEDEWKRQKERMKNFAERQSPIDKLSILGFICYFDNQWISTITPKGFSIYKLSKRTNNCSESFNSILLHLIGVRPVVNVFFRKYTNCM